MKAGFTLIELLAVVAGVAILGVLVIIATGNATSAAKDAMRSYKIKLLNNALQQANARGDYDPVLNGTDEYAVLDFLIAKGYIYFPSYDGHHP